MSCPVNNLQEIVGKMAGDKVEIAEIKLALFGRHQKKKKNVHLTVSFLQD